jgi:hypothetical protein
MRKLSLLGLLALSTVAMTGCGDQAPSKADKPHEPSADKTSILFVVNATEGSISGSDDLVVTLRLQGHSDVWFTDRPVRRSGNLNTKVLLKRWNKNFGNDSPNAVLVMDAQQESVPVTLSSPRLRGNTVTFKATRLSEVPDTSTVKHLKTDPSPPRQFGHASLFIDSSAEQQFQACMDQYSPRLGLYEARNLCVQYLNPNY